MADGGRGSRREVGVRGRAAPVRGNGGHRLTAALRRDSRVAPLELLFDLVFVLALTQCTALMADVPSLEGVMQALLVLSALWWSWVGYAWLTSVVDPESGLVRVVVSVAMAAFLVAALCVSGAFAGAGTAFALAYAVVRSAHVVLFVLASQDSPALRSTVVGFSASTAAGVVLLLVAAQTDGKAQALVWVAALAVDVGGPLLFGIAGWQLAPEHFAERHGLIVLIALGESVVAIGAGVVPTADGGVPGAVLAAAVVATVLVVALWWLYFDVVALVAARRLEEASPGYERNAVARDAFSLLHLPMVAGIVLVALGLKKTLAHVGDPLDAVPAAALLGGAALYLIGHVAFRLRTVRELPAQRLVAAAVLLLALPLATRVPAVLAVTGVTVLLAALVAYEAVRFAELRASLLARRDTAGHGAQERPGRLGA